MSEEALEHDALTPEYRLFIVYIDQREGPEVGVHWADSCSQLF